MHDEAPLQKSRRGCHRWLAIRSGRYESSNTEPLEMDRLDLSGIGGWIRLCYAGKGIEASISGFVANNQVKVTVVFVLRCIVLRLVVLYRGFILCRAFKRR